MAAPLRVMREPSVKEGTFFYHRGDGFYFNKSSTHNGTIYLKCVRYETGCRARATLSPEQGLRRTARSPDHNHNRDRHYADEVALRRCVIERARSMEFVSFRDIIDQEGAWYDVEVSSRVTLPRMRNAMRNARLQNYPPLPDSLRQLTNILNDERYRVITQSDDGGDNLYAGSVTDVDGFHHVMFMSMRGVDLLRTSKIIHADGTFKVVPTGANGDLLSQQVYVILTTWDHHILPLAWVLMESQRGAAYDAVLQLLRRLLGHDEVVTERIITDFERAQQNSWQNNFDFHVQGCLWHLVRAFVEEARTLNLGWWMRNVDEYRRIIRLAGTLPILPRRFMQRGLVLLTREAMHEGPAFYRRMRPFLRYLNRNWIGHPLRSHWMCVFNSQHRTNNAAESFNKLMKLLMGNHPNIYAFINTLIRMERCAFRDAVGLEAGRRVANSRKASAVTNDARLRRLRNGLYNPRGNLDEAIWAYMRRASSIMRRVFNNAVYP